MNLVSSFSTNFKQFYLCAFFLLWAGFKTTAQVEETIDTTSLETILIKSVSIEERLKDIPAAVSVLPKTELQRGAPELLNAAFNRQPGIYSQDGALNTNRITIRGIGARAQYGTNRVKAYFNEIPISSGDGETVINDIDQQAIDRVEIIKGPNSSLYGSGLGGVIHLFHNVTPLDKNYAKTTHDFGSFGMQKQSVSVGHSDSKKNLFANYTHLKTDGFRENSNFDRKTFTLHGTLSSRGYSQLSFFGNFTRLKGYIASSINATDFENNPEVAATNWREAQGYESYDRLISGISYSFKISEKLTNASSIFLNYRGAYEPRPFDILAQESTALGVRTRFNLEEKIQHTLIKISFGGEILTENYNGKNFENLYQSFPGQGSVQGDIFSNIAQKRNYFNLFSQANAILSEKLHLTLGLNLNSTNYTLENLFDTSAFNENGKHTFKTMWSPRIAATYKISSSKNIYSNISRGFSTPTVDETLTPEGGINTQLHPETGWNYEMGFKGNWFTNLYTEVAVYSIRIENLLVARRTAEDQYVGLNAGKTNHTGIEILLNYKWNPTAKLEIKPFFSGSFHHFRFDDFMDDGNDYSGNKLTGVPESIFNLGIDIFSQSGFTFFSNMGYVSQIPLNDANSLFTDSYTLATTKVSYRTVLFNRIETTIHFGINNVFNEKYAASILPNAIGFGGSDPRYFYPGNPRNIFGGLSLYYSF